MIRGMMMTCLLLECLHWSLGFSCSFFDRDLVRVVGLGSPSGLVV